MNQPKQSSAPTAFKSSLFDTVKIRIALAHPSLYDLCAADNSISYVNKQYRVRSKFGTYAIITSESGRSSLLIEASIPKFLTGQNLVGTEDLKTGAIELIDAVLKRARITATDAERRRYRAGTFELLRVDYAAHVNCGTAGRVPVVLNALRATLAGQAWEYSAYKNETVYWGQYSDKRTLRAYDKGRLMLKRPPAKRVYAREKLMGLASGLVRVEVTLRAAELQRLKLRRPDNWSAKVARDLLEEFLDRLLPLQAKVPSVEGMDLLTATLRDRLELWLRGSPDAFTRYGPSSFCHARREIRRVTAIDIKSSLDAATQARHFQELQDVFEAGRGYKSWESKWEKLKAGKPKRI